MTASLLHPVETELTHIVDELTRRRLLTLAGATGLGLGLSACGSETPSSEPASATRTVQTQNGPVDVPVRPQRIVALDGYSVMAAIDAGVVPVAVPDGISVLVPPDEVERVRALEGTGLPVSPNLEAIATFRPDLILRGNGDAGLYSALTKIAPTVVMAAGTAHDWTAAIETFMIAAGGPDVVEAVREHYEERVAVVRERYGAVIDRIRWYSVQRFPDYVFVAGPDFAGMSIYADLGIRFGEATTGTGVKLSTETIGNLADADAILVREQTGASGTETGGYDLMLADPLFGELPATRSGHTASTRFGLPSSYSVAELLLDDIAALLARADGSR